MQWLEACCWINEWRNRQFNKQTNATISARVEWILMRRDAGRPFRERDHQFSEAPEPRTHHFCSESPPQRPQYCSPFPSRPRQLVVSSLCFGDMWFYCQPGISNEKQMVSNVTWKKKPHKQQQNYMFFFPVVFTGRVCDLFAVNTAYNDMVHRSAARSVRHSLHTCIKCNAIGVWRLSHWAECCPGAKAELQHLFPWDH